MYKSDYAFQRHQSIKSVENLSYKSFKKAKNISKILCKSYGVYKI